MIRYQEFDTIPDQLLSTSPRDLHKLIGGPSLIHIAGNHERPIFISTLLHGNEHTGILAIQKLLQQRQTKNPLSRPITLLIGNTAAAATNQRLLPGQPDFNRIWTTEHASQPGHLVQRVVQLVTERNYFLCVDIHNNTGKNPLYSCISRLDDEHLSFAGLFAPTCIYFTQPASTQTVFLSDITAALTLECSHSGEQLGLDRATEFINSILHLKHLPARLTREVQVFHTVARLRIRPGVSFRLAQENKTRDDSHFVLRADIDKLNFSPSTDKTLLGTWSLENVLPLVIDDMQEGNGQKHDTALSLEDGEVYLRKGYYPAMFTRNEEVIEQDCLGYLMEEIIAKS